EAVGAAPEPDHRRAAGSSARRPSRAELRGERATSVPGDRGQTARSGSVRRWGAYSPSWSTRSRLLLGGPFVELSGRRSAPGSGVAGLWVAVPSSLSPLRGRWHAGRASTVARAEGRRGRACKVPARGWGLGGGRSRR